MHGFLWLCQAQCKILFSEISFRVLWWAACLHSPKFRDAHVQEMVGCSLVEGGKDFNTQVQDQPCWSKFTSPTSHSPTTGTVWTIEGVKQRKSECQQHCINFVDYHCLLKVAQKQPRHIIQSTPEINFLRLYGSTPQHTINHFITHNTKIINL